MDFLEIASYVFTADCSTPRGEWTDAKQEEPWGRNLAFLIGVREPDFFPHSGATSRSFGLPEVSAQTRGCAWIKLNQPNILGPIVESYKR